MTKPKKSISLAALIKARTQAEADIAAALLKFHSVTGKTIESVEFEYLHTSGWASDTGSSFQTVELSKVTARVVL